MRTIVALALLLAWVAPAPAQEDDATSLDEVGIDFVARFRRGVEERDWKGVFEACDRARGKDGQKLVRDPAAPVWRSAGEFLAREVARLPREAFRWYRTQYDGPAITAYKRAREADDLCAMQKVVEDFFYSEIADEALDWLAVRCFEAGRLSEALYWWRLLLQEYPDSDIRREVTAARLAVAAHATRSARALDELRAYVAACGIDGAVCAGGEETTLGALLQKLAVPPEPKRETTALPLIEAERTAAVHAPRNHVMMWSRELGTRREREIPQTDFPYLATYAKVGDRVMVLVSDGVCVLAINPARASFEAPEACIYWRFAVNRPEVRRRRALPVASSPLFGVAVDGGQAFTTLYSELKVAEEADPFQGPCRLAAFNLADGRLLWDTDDERIHALYRELDGGRFYRQNWAISGPPIVRGERLYIGICTSPLGDSASAVLCVDRHSGRPLWVTNLCAASNGFWRGRGGTMVVYLTMLAEDGGVVYAHANLGVVAAVHAMTGRVLWLSKYPRARDGRRGFALLPEIRPASPIAIHRGRLYTLPQDQWEWQVFDAQTGARLAVPLQGFEWRIVQQIVGVSGDYILLGGSETTVINLATQRAYSLPGANVYRSGRGAIADGYVYMPSAKPAPAVLSVYDAASWKNVDISAWRRADEVGNVLVAGEYLVVTTPSRVSIYASEATVDRAYTRRLSQSPPSAAAFLEHAELMRRNERLKRASESYRAFLAAVDGDPAFEEKAREVKRQLQLISR